jgi:DHA1 family bicyclomycin/chloramphenicol resistance-like MFS transporter
VQLFFLNGVIKYGMEKLITTALVSFLVVSATYIALFYNTPIRCSCFVVVFCNAFFQYRFSFGNLRAMAMEPVGHIAGLLPRLLALFLLSWPFLSAFYWPFYCR